VLRALYLLFDVRCVVVVVVVVVVVEPP